jgi:hypothetical protein
MIVRTNGAVDEKTRSSDMSPAADLHVWIFDGADDVDAACLTRHRKACRRNHDGSRTHLSFSKKTKIIIIRGSGAALWAGRRCWMWTRRMP